MQRIAQAAQDGNGPAQHWMEIAEEFNDGPTLLTLEDFEPEAVLEARLAAEHFGAPWPPGVADFERALGY